MSIIYSENMNYVNMFLFCHSDSIFVYWKRISQYIKKADLDGKLYQTNPLVN